jgi:hypothetical protein
MLGSYVYLGDQTYRMQHDPPPYIHNYCRTEHKVALMFNVFGSVHLCTVQ